MTDLEIKCYEQIAKDIHTQAQEILGGGNLALEELELIIYIEKRLEKNNTKSSLISALSADLEKSNTEIQNMLIELGDHRYGY